MLYERGDISKIGKQQTGQGENQKIAMDWVINIIVAFSKSENVSHVQRDMAAHSFPAAAEQPINLPWVQIQAIMRVLII